MYFMPPYVIEPEQIDWVFDIMEQAVDIAVQD
jgi:adenosylmethionine-8-amino-7-oxononanoate aminotransferase